MDTVVKICLALIIILVAWLAGTAAYTAYTENAYRTSLTGTMTYSCTITTDAPLYNITFFIPVPADMTGNSPAISAFSARQVAGVPGDWEATLFDTGKSTLIKLTAPAVLPPPGTTRDKPYTITLTSESRQHSAIETGDPAGSGAVFRPVRDLTGFACTQVPAGSGGRCFSYTTSLFADYRTAPETTVTVTSAVAGKNTWTIFGPQSNEYHTTVSTTLRGENHGWAVMNGSLAAGIGTYEYPAGSGDGKGTKTP